MRTAFNNNWRGVVVYPSRSIDSSETARYTELLSSQRVQRIYLDELDSAEQSIGIETVKLVIEPESSAAAKARDLINIARQQIADELTQREILQLIETIIVYKFPQKSREEIERMLGLSDIKETRVYQEAKIEGKLEAIPFMLRLGATVEQIAEALTLDIELVRQVAQSVQLKQQSNEESDANNS